MYINLTDLITVIGDPWDVKFWKRSLPFNAKILQFKWYWQLQAIQWYQFLPFLKVARCLHFMGGAVLSLILKFSTSFWFLSNYLCAMSLRTDRQTGNQKNKHTFIFLVLLMCDGTLLTGKSFPGNMWKMDKMLRKNHSKT